MAEGVPPEGERERSLLRLLDEFRRDLESDPLLPSADICRRLDAIADEFLDAFGVEPDPAIQT